MSRFRTMRDLHRSIGPPVETIGQVSGGREGPAWVCAFCGTWLTEITAGDTCPALEQRPILWCGAREGLCAFDGEHVH